MPVVNLTKSAILILLLFYISQFQVLDCGLPKPDKRSSLPSRSSRIFYLFSTPSHPGATMAELMSLLEKREAFQSELMRNYLSTASARSGSLVSGGTFLQTDDNCNISGSATYGCSVTSLTVATPYPTGRLEPGQGRANLNTQTFSTNPEENLNGNNVYVSSSQIVKANVSCPQIMSLDNLSNQSCPKPNLNELNKTGLTSTGSRSNHGYNVNNNNGDNLNLTPGVNANLGSQRSENMVSIQRSQTSGAGPALPDSNANSSINVSQILSELTEIPDDSLKLLMGEVTSAIVGSHMNTTINTHANVAAARERVQREASEMPNISSLSVSGSNLWQHFMGAMLPEITKVIKFTTSLPGFSEIVEDDQVSLVKRGCFQVMVARFCLLIDHLKEEMLDPTLQVIASRDAVKSMPMGPFLDQFFNVAKQLNPLRLSDGEIGLYTAVLMVCPEHEALKDKSAVKALQQLLINALYQLLKQTRPDARETLTSLISLTPVFHQINEAHLNFIKMIKMKSPADYEKKFPTLHKELFDTC